MNPVQSIFGYCFNPLFYRRRFHAYCVGMPKSGTHSIADIFSKRYRSCHEPESRELTGWVLALRSHSAPPEVKIASRLRARDRRLWLEMDSSPVNYFLVDQLLEEFKDAKFILTIRDCYSWLDSSLNHVLSRPAPPQGRRLQPLRFGDAPRQYPPEEHILAEHGLYLLDQYLRYWNSHNETVLRTVPVDRLLVVKTDAIASEIPRIADFLGIPPDTLDIEKSHSYRGAKKLNLLSKIPRDYLELKVRTHCRKLMEFYFPAASF